MPWIDLQAEEQIDTIIERSAEKPQIIFKHSTRCGVSRMVMNDFSSKYGIVESEADLYFLDLLSFRSVSNAIAYAFQVYHESPQLIVVRNGETMMHASHGEINNLDFSLID